MIVQVKRKSATKQRKSPNLYKLALEDPFHPAALGARVPDLYSFPTAPFHSRGTVTAQVDGVGSFGALLLPNPIASISLTAGSLPTSSMYNYPVSFDVWAACTEATMRGSLSNFRLVSCGFKIRNLIAPLNCTGKIIIAPVVVSGDTPGPETLKNIQTYGYNIINSATGLGSGYIDTAILNLPGAKEYTLQELIDKPIELSTRPITNNAFEFHSTATENKSNITSEYTPVQSFTSATGVGTVSADTRAWCDQSGFSGFLIHISGAPITISAVEIEYIYHFEGSPPQITNGSLVSGQPATSHVNVRSFFEALQEVATIDNIRRVADGVSYLRGNFARAGIHSLMDGTL